MATFRATIKLGSSFVGGSCLKHPPDCQIIIAFGTIDINCRKSLCCIFPIQYSESTLFLCGYVTNIYCNSRFLLRTSKSTFRTSDSIFFKFQSHSCFTIWTEFQIKPPFVGKIQLNVKDPLKTHRQI